jgi:hypothetical protein
MSGHEGCAVCRARDAGRLTWFQQLMSPRRLHIEAEAALGLNLARRVLHSKSGFPFRSLSGMQETLRETLFRPLKRSNRTRCIAQQVLHTHDCPLRRERQWPTIVTPTDPGRGA